MGLMATLPFFFIFGFSVFLLGFSVFMYFEEKKFGDNQFSIKLLPPPSAPSAQILDSAVPSLEKHAA
jgi:hypothetical protein